MSKLAPQARWHKYFEIRFCITVIARERSDRSNLKNEIASGLTSLMSTPRNDGYLDSNEGKRITKR